ncbi:MAG: hypothetical protein R3A12_16960 [Ignavibacteria bacterium]
MITLATVQGIGEKIKGLRKARFKFPETMVYNCAFFNRDIYLFIHTKVIRKRMRFLDVLQKFLNKLIPASLDLQKAEMMGSTDRSGFGKSQKQGDGDA